MTWVVESDRGLGLDIFVGSVAVRLVICERNDSEMVCAVSVSHCIPYYLALVGSVDGHTALL